MALLGCIADDFTGASDIASFFKIGGLQTVLYNEIPQKNADSEAQALVIALKTRTADTNLAVEQSLEALEWLKKQGVKQIYIKYCSTFDSTPKGNIGPISDAVMDALHAEYSLVCPALPVNGRTVTEGKLYVNGVPLHESSMKDHPLTPMWDCDLKNLMEAQSRYSSHKIGKLFEDRKKLAAFIKEKKKSGIPFYLIPDCEKNEDSRCTADFFHDLPLITGGSGLAPYLAEIWAQNNKAKEKIFSKPKGPVLLLAGSCSVATRGQIRFWKEKGYKAIQIDPLKLKNGELTFDALKKEIECTFPEPILFYSSDDPDKVKRIQETAGKEIAALLENTAAELAAYALQKGAERIIVAGGETSGAVTQKLSFDSFYIGESVAPGVPIMVPVQNLSLRLILKSGNFGQEDFFLKAFRMIQGHNKEEY